MRDKNGAQVSKLRAILCALKCPFFVAKVIHNLLTPEECAELLHSVNEKGKVKPALYK